MKHTKLSSKARLGSRMKHNQHLYRATQVTDDDARYAPYWFDLQAPNKKAVSKFIEDKGLDPTHFEIEKLY